MWICLRMGSRRGSLSGERGWVGGFTWEITLAIAQVVGSAAECCSQFCLDCY